MFVVCSVVIRLDGWIATKLLAQQRKLRGKECVPLCTLPTSVWQVWTMSLIFLSELRMVYTDCFCRLWKTWQSMLLTHVSAVRCGGYFKSCSHPSSLRQPLLKTSTQEPYLITMFSRLIFLSLTIGHSHWNVQHIILVIRLFSYEVPYVGPWTTSNLIMKVSPRKAPPLFSFQSDKSKTWTLLLCYRCPSGFKINLLPI